MRFIKIENYDDVPKLGSEKIQNHLEDWVMHLTERGLKAHTIRGKLSAVELFLEMNKVLFHKKIVRKLIPSSDYIPGGDKPFTTKDIQRFLKSTTKLRTKALIHFFASTGVRPASITDPVLRLKHIGEMPFDCKAVRVYDGSKEGYWAFLIPEATKALDHYLRSRRLNGEKLNPESPVFINTNKQLRMKNDFMSAQSARQIMQKRIKASRIERTKEGNRFDKASLYGFRKRFNTILKLNNNINSNIAEKLMAHKRGLDGAYLRPTREECFEEFVKAIPKLTISDEYRDKYTIQELKKEKSEIENIKDEMKIMQQGMKKLAYHRQTLFDFNQTKNPEKLKDLDLDILEKWNCWEAIVAGDFDIGQLANPNNHSRIRDLPEPYPGFNRNLNNDLT